MRDAAEPPPKALDLLSHILAAEHLWLARLRASSATVPVWPAFDPAGCARLAEETHAAYRAYLEALRAEDLAGEVPYTNSAGAPFRSTRADILLHVALHGSYHRGQMALLLRQAGAVPQPTDYIAYVRGAPAATRQS